MSNLYIPLNFKNAYVASWNFAVEQALPKNMSLQVAYVANHGTRIDIAQNINQPRIYGQSGTYDPFYVAFRKTATVTQYFMASPATMSRCRPHSPAAMQRPGLQHSISVARRRAIRLAHRTEACCLQRNLRRNYNLLDFDRKKNFEQTVT